VDNIKIDRREIGWDGMDWIDLAQDRDQWRALVNTVNFFELSLLPNTMPMIVTLNYRGENTSSRVILN
jgi:hypothetical protein